MDFNNVFNNGFNGATPECEVVEVVGRGEVGIGLMAKSNVARKSCLVLERLGIFYTAGRLSDGKSFSVHCRVI
jgi:hypothetical protein